MCLAIRFRHTHFVPIRVLNQVFQGTEPPGADVVTRRVNCVTTLCPWFLSFDNPPTRVTEGEVGSSVTFLWIPHLCLPVFLMSRLFLQLFYRYHLPSSEGVQCKLLSVW